MQAILWPIISWLLREVIVKFVVFSAVVALVGLVAPVAVEYLGDFIHTAWLEAAFAGLPPGVWYWLDFFRVDFGVPVLISAAVAGFLIRRLPVIG
jgi:hypothetical protein